MQLATAVVSLNMGNDRVEQLSEALTAAGQIYPARGDGEPHRADQRNEADD
jgi:hypothetical protein